MFIPRGSCTVTYMEYVFFTSEVPGQIISSSTREISFLTPILAAKSLILDQVGILKQALRDPQERCPFILLHLNYLVCASSAASPGAADAMKVTRRSIGKKQWNPTFMHSAVSITRCVSSSHELIHHIERLVIQIFFNTIPFHESNEFQTIRFIINGERPSQLQSPEMGDNTWHLIQSCWESVPSKRPKMTEIVEALALPV